MSYPLNYEIAYGNEVYMLNATELAWLTAMLQGANKVFSKLDSENADLQSLMYKGLVNPDGTLTRSGVFLAEYVFMVHPQILSNPLYQLTYEYIFNDSTIGVDMKVKESYEPKYNFQKIAKKFIKKIQSKNESYDIQNFKKVVDLEEALAVTPMTPHKDVIKVENSSVITGLAYDDDSQDLDVHMKGGAIYRYLGVPSIMFNALKTADLRLDAEYDVKKKDGTAFKNSIGGYYAKMIKNNYKVIRIA